MTTGEYLIDKLGLKNFTTPRICRIIDGAYRTFIIYVDSTSPQTLITRNRINLWMPKVGVYKFPFDDKGGVLPDRRVPTLPLMDLKDFNGNLAPGNFILVDLGGRFGHQTNFVWEGKILFSGEGLNEEVYLKDFDKYGMSDLTATFRADRNASGQQEVKTAKLIQCDLTPEGSAIFSWLTEPTKLASPVLPGGQIPPNHQKYDAKHKPMEVDPKTFELIPNPSRTYTLQIEVVDLLKWVDTYPDKTEIGPEDFKDILSVCSIRLWNSSPSWHWQGMNANLTRLDGAIHPTDIMPKVWNQPDRHGDVYWLDKHTSGLLANIAYWKNNMASMLTKKLRDEGYLK